MDNVGRKLQSGSKALSSISGAFWAHWAGIPQCKRTNSSFVRLVINGSARWTLLPCCMQIITKHARCCCWAQPRSDTHPRSGTICSHCGHRHAGQSTNAFSSAYVPRHVVRWPGILTSLLKTAKNNAKNRQVSKATNTKQSEPVISPLILAQVCSSWSQGFTAPREPLVEHL